LCRLAAPDLVTGVGAGQTGNITIGALPTLCPGIVHTNIVATTRFSGVSAEEEAAKQQRYDKLYAARRYGPEKVAAQIVKAVEQGRDVVPVTPEAWLQYRFNRFAPAVARFFAARVKLT
ncbi:hypothetical protein ACFXIV_33390, partial [Nocardia sp. NPDC059236]